MSGFATLWDIWSAGLIGGPEPPGRRTEAEIAALRAEATRNEALACESLRDNWRRYHEHSPQPEPPSMRAYRRLQILERIDNG